jgi:hypothetical protein
MKDHPVKLLEERCVIEPGIFSNPFNADIDVRLNRYVGLGVLECDDVCIGIMVEEVLIDLMQVLIGAEDIIDGFHLKALLFKEEDNERF